MDEAQRGSLVEAYIRAYNAFDVDKIVSLLHDEVMFENYIQGQHTMSLKGKAEFRQVVEQGSWAQVVRSG